MNFLAEIRKAIAGLLVAGAGAAYTALTVQCGHGIDWHTIGLAVVTGLAVYLVPNKQAPGAGIGQGG